MEIGDRVLSPSGFFPSENVEMRLFGKYESSLVPAILFRLIESASELKQIPPAPPSSYHSLVSLFPDNYIPEIKHAIDSMHTFKWQKAAIQKFVQQCGEFLKYTYQLCPSDSNSLERLCVAGGFSLDNNYFGGQVNPKARAVEVRVGLKSGLLFLLYTAFTFDSFLDLPCGHFGLKYEFYCKMRSKADSRAISCQELSGFTVKSDCCDKDVTNLVFRSCFSETNAEVDTISDGFVCLKCGKQSKSRMVVVCDCQPTCMRCSVKNYFTDSYNVTPCCELPLTDYMLVTLRRAILAWNPSLSTIITQLKHDKNVLNCDRLVKNCKSCKSEFVDRMNGEMYCEKCMAEKGFIARNPKKHHQKSISEIMQGSDVRMNEMGPEIDDIPMEDSPGHRLQEQNEDQIGIAPPKVSEISLRNKGKPRPPIGPNTVPHLRRKQQSTAEQNSSSLEVGVTSNPPLTYERQQSDEVGNEEENKANTPKTSFHQITFNRWTNKQCKTCEYRFTNIKSDKTCDCGCECSKCVADAVIAMHLTSCLHCSCEYSKEMIASINEKTKRCHVCEIAVNIDEIETNAPCGVCKYCVIPVVEPSLFILERIAGICSLCKGDSFKINEKWYETRDAQESQSACCSKSKSTSAKYYCGHFVCKSHERTLKQCRRCHSRLPNS